jgi:drug/metabolite transporter (DMT)-like permease
VDAVAYSLASAALFGAMTVAIRLGFVRSRDLGLASLTMTAIAFLIMIAIAVAVPQHGDASLSAVWPFALAGVLSPGLSNLFFTRAIAEAGASRASVVVGTAPLVAVTVALTALREPVRVPLVAGACLIVLGGVALAGERGRPADFRLIGLTLAFVATVLFAARDNVVRWLAEDTHVAPLAGAAATLLGGTVALLGVLTATHEPLAPRGLARSARAFAPAAVLMALSYASLFEAYFRGRVTVVSPLVATESLWGVTLSALLIGRSELVGRRIVAGAALVVAGGALIGAARA